MFSWLEPEPGRGMRMDHREDRAPRQCKATKGFTKKGLIMVYTGEGKGKTTAAVGTALRALGHGYKVAIVQFIKGKWKTGEEKALKMFRGQCDVFVLGDGFTWETGGLERDVETARKAWIKCCDLLSDQEHQLVILDEINNVIDYNFLDAQEVIRQLKEKPPFKHVLLTGRGAPQALMDMADLVTRMTCVKHPFDKGIKAQPGIDY